MTTERVDIIVSETGAREVKRRIEDIGNGANKSVGPLQQLNRALAGVATLATLRALQQTADAYTNIQNALVNVTSSTEQLTQVTGELYAMSQRTRTSFTSNAEAYRRFALSGRDLGMTQREVLQFTESLNQAIVISGASAMEAQAGMIQLSQGLASGTLRGDELRSVLEQLPAVADVIAKGLGVTRGELRKMGEDGKITADQIFVAFKDARSELEEKFGKTIPTIGQSFTQLKNSVTIFVGELDKSLGLSQSLSGIIKALADNVDVLAKALGIAAIAWIGFFFAANVSTLIAISGAIIGNIRAFVQLAATVRTAAGAMALLNAAFLTNPFVIITTLVVGLVAAFVFFGDEIIRTLDKFKILGKSITLIFAGVADGINGVFAGSMEVIKGYINAIRVALFHFGDEINRFLGKDLFNVGNIIGSDVVEVMKSAGRSTAENFDKGFEEATKDGFVAKYLARQAAGFAPGATAGTLDQVVPGGQAKTGPTDAAMKAMEEALKRQKKLLEEIKGPAYDYAQTLADMRVLLDTGQISTDEFTTALDKLNLQLLENDKTLNGGIQRGLLKVKDQFSDIGVLAENTIVNAFGEAEDALVEFVKTGELNFSGLVDSILSDLARLAIRQAIIAPLTKALGFADGGLISGYANGGLISGRGGPRSDSNIVAVSDGEYIVNAAATKQFLPLLEMINGGSTPSKGSYSSAGNMGSGGTSVVFAPTVQVNVEGGGNSGAAESTGLGENIAASVERALEGMFSEFLMKQQRPGGQLNTQETY